MGIPYVPDMTSCGDTWAQYDEVRQDTAMTLAWSAVRHLTGGQVGHDPVTVRPCGQTCYVEFAPTLRSGQWYNMDCSVHGVNACRCLATGRLTLRTRVAEVRGVWIDGVEFFDWRRVDNDTLVRTDGEGWPMWQDLTLEPTEVDTFAVTYVPGLLPGADGLAAVGVLACEFGKALSNAKCRLPSSVTAVTRQGVSMDFTEGMFANGVTGIREVDAWLMTVNPGHLKQPTQVWSPDLPHLHYDVAATLPDLS